MGYKSLLACALILVPFAAHAACSGSGTTWTCTAGSTVSQIQSAYNSASDGATITLAAGSYSWGSGEFDFTNSKGATLICATVGGCTLNMSPTGGGNIRMSNLSGMNTKLYRISGFVFNGGTGVFSPMIWFWGPSGGMTNLRIDHNTFQNFAEDTDLIYVGTVDPKGGMMYGLIDNNTLNNSVNIQLVKQFGDNSTSHTISQHQGTINNLFVEDNVFNFSRTPDLGSGCIDSWAAGAVVFRFNTVKNCLVTAHGVSHGNTVNHEFYFNKMERTAGSGDWDNGTRLYHHQGSGQIVAFENVFTAASQGGGALDIHHYRSCDPEPGEGFLRCDGTRAQDGNRSPTGTWHGYPCFWQPGRVGLSYSPMYAWRNRWNNGTKVGVSVSNPAECNTSHHIQPNRDYFDAVSASAQTSPTSPFNGTTGMGYGTLANRPTTCTPSPEGSTGGVGYWATDQGEWNARNSGPDGQLYRCSATNTWTVHYKPFIYPHPLQGGVQGGGAPDAVGLIPPANLRVVP